MPESHSLNRFNKVILALALVTLGIYAAGLAAALLYFRSEVRGQVLSRDGTLLTSVAQYFHDGLVPPVEAIDLLEVALESSGIRGVIGVRLYAPDGALLGKVPGSLYALELPRHDRMELRAGEPVTRHYRMFHLETLFSDQLEYENPANTPVTEILAPVHGETGEQIAVIQYWLDGQEVSAELDHLDRSLGGLGLVFLLSGTLVFLIVFLFARRRLLQMGRLLEDRNRSLEQANADLALAARTSAIGSVTSHLFHGLKNPLAGLKTYLRLTAGDEEAFALTDRMQSLIDETLTVIRESDSDRDFELSFAELVQLSRTRFTGEHNTSVVIEGSGNGSIPGRKSRLLFLVLRNLVENAVDVSPSGETVRIRFELEGNRLRVEVEDKGSGLPESIRERLFEPVQSNKRTGTGIGLALSAAIARQIPASLALKESSGEGTTFSIEMPL